jgi:2-hydroxy-3-keto-5-methylthiopentenyl-1-phosphate phosphatase
MRYLTEIVKTLVQCDFDGTVTEEDASFMILDTFAGGKWRHLFRDYQEGRMTVGQFNTKAFSMVKADKESILNILRGKVKVRPGFQELVSFCRRKEFRFVIVSNGLEFYIKEILGDLGLNTLEVFAAKTDFHPGGLEVRHNGPDGKFIDAHIKAAYVDSFLDKGYCIVYIGDGASDVLPAKKSHHVFAIDSLLESCREKNIKCFPFSDFYEVVKVLETWQ